MDWNLLSQRETLFKGQNREALNDQGPLKPKGPLKSKDGHESKRTIPHVCGGGGISQPSEPFDPLIHYHNIGAVCKIASYPYILSLDWGAMLWCREGFFSPTSVIRQEGIWFIYGLEPSLPM